MAGMPGRLPAIVLLTAVLLSACWNAGASTSGSGEQVQPEGSCQPPQLINEAEGLYYVHCISPSLTMVPGQVINTNLIFPNPFPTEQPIAIYNQSAQLVYVSSKQPVPAFEVYMHHFVTPDTLIVPPPTGQGLMARPAFPEPFSLLVPANHMVPPAKRQVNIHLINTVGVEDVLSCIECRCPEGLDLHNNGGVICCRDCPSTASTGPFHYAMEYDTVYRLIAAESSVAPTHLARIDAARGIGERIEYEVPQDPSGVQVVEWEFSINSLVPPADHYREPLQLLRCDGHQHIGGMCLELFDGGDLVCQSCPVYAPQPSIRGDMDYVVEMTTTNIAPARTVDPDKQLRIVAKYNATEQHTGVMSIMFLYYTTGKVLEGSAISAATAGVHPDHLTLPQLVEKYPSIGQHVSRTCQDQLIEVYNNCPMDSAESSREENAIVCCSMMGALSASRCLCDEIAHAEAAMLSFMLFWQQSCSTEKLEAVFEVTCPADKAAQGSWSWHNMFQYVGSDDIIAPVYTEAKYALSAFSWVWYNSMAIIMMFVAAHAVLKRAGKPVYPALQPHEQYIATTHVVFCVVYAAQMLPYTWLTAQLLFGPEFIATVRAHYPFFFMVFVCHGCLYLAEGAFRGMVKFNAMLLVHHFLFCLLPLITVTSRSVFVFKVVFMIDLFATYEFGLYAALILRRLAAPGLWVERALAGGVGLYAATRVVQAVLLVAFFAGSLPLMCGDSSYWLLLGLVVLLVIIQNYTFVIYHNMYKALKADNSGLPSKSGRAYAVVSPAETPKQNR